MEDVLDAQIDRELQRLLALMEDRIEAALDPGEALVVEPGIADDMGDEVAVGELRQAFLGAADSGEGLYMVVPSPQVIVSNGPVASVAPRRWASSAPD